MFNKNNNPFIWERKNALDKNVCERLIRTFERADAKNLTDKGMLGGGLGSEKRYDPSMKQSQDLYLFKDSYEYEDNILYTNLSGMLKEYQEYIKQSVLNDYETKVFYGTDTVIDTGYQIQRTSPGGFYNWHNDFSMNEEGFARQLTYLWYLNTIKDGGYTEFYNGYKVHAEQGKLLIFPATWSYVHRGYPPKKDTKYIVTGWVLTKM